MALYDRDYANHAQEEVSAHDLSRTDFIKKTYQLFAGSLLGGTVGAYIGMGMVQTVAEWKWGFIILELALLFAVYAMKKKEGLNYILLFAFTFVSGLTLAPILTVTLGMAGGGAIVTNAFLLTTVAFGGLSMFAMNTSRDFSAMGKMLFITLIVVVVASILNMFMHSPLMQIVIASVSAILFSAFILYDTQNIIKGAYETPIEGAIALYLDFLNLFVSLLQILGIFGNDD